jgi:GntR family transcriptional regulator, transcriptional repressor for pyruvate dehydrogenase complex
MSKASSSPRLEAVRTRLRELALAADDGALVGSEDALVQELGVSRSTVRQAARLLEGEGLLRVKRGINGGYYGSRPDENTIKATVSDYLGTLDAEHGDVSAVAAVLWVEVLRRAASLNSPASRKFAEMQRRAVLEIDKDAPLRRIVELEETIREGIFELIDSPYIRLIFHINATFSRARYGSAPPDLVSPELVQAWQEAKLMELGAIAEADVQLAIMAARYAPQVWERSFKSNSPAPKSGRHRAK